MLRYWLARIENTCQRGVVMVFYAILLPVLFGFMGLSLDAGLAYVEKGKAQDIADAAALAGAAKLSADGHNNMYAIKAAVESFAEANGLKLQEGDLVEKAANAWDTKESVASGHQAVLAYGVVNVTRDDKTVPRVRVRITKRVPVVFLSMVEGIADNIVVSAKAAAEGGSEVGTPIKNDKPVFMCQQLDLAYQSANQIVIPKSYEYSVYAWNENIIPEKLPGTGMIYAANIGGRAFNYDVMNEVVVYNPSMPNGWEFTPSNRDQTTYEVYNTQGVPQEKLDIAAQKKADQIADRQAKHDLYAQLKQEAVDGANAMAADKQAYIDGAKNGTNKRYIGPVPNPDNPSENIVVSTVLPDDTEIDLYVDGTANLGGQAKYWMDKQWNVLTNFQLKNVKKINNIYFSNKDTVIATEGITYGKVYDTHGNFGIVGSSNTFSGTIYGTGNIWVGGKNNKLVASDGLISIIAPQFVYLGKDYKEVTITKAEEKDGVQLYEVNLTDGLNVGMQSDWRLYLDFLDDGSGSGTGSGEGTGSGSATEGSVTTVKVKLVE